jgi:hypothetical protein
VARFCELVPLYLGRSGVYLWHSRALHGTTVIIWIVYVFHQ